MPSASKMELAPKRKGTNKGVVCANEIGPELETLTRIASNVHPTCQ
jgi:hypothetical protein